MPLFLHPSNIQALTKAAEIRSNFDPTLLQDENGFLIPRPPNAFILFRRHAQNHFKAQNNQHNAPPLTMSRVSSSAGMTWKNASSETRQYFKSLAETEAEKLLKKYPWYTYQPTPDWYTVRIFLQEVKRIQALSEVERRKFMERGFFKLRTLGFLRKREKLPDVEPYHYTDSPEAKIARANHRGGHDTRKYQLLGATPSGPEASPASYPMTSDRPSSSHYEAGRTTSFSLPADRSLFPKRSRRRRIRNEITTDQIPEILSSLLTDQPALPRAPIQNEQLTVPSHLPSVTFTPQIPSAFVAQTVAATTPPAWALPQMAYRPYQPAISPNNNLQTPGMTLPSNCVIFYLYPHPAGRFLLPGHPLQVSDFGGSIPTPAVPMTTPNNSTALQPQIGNGNLLAQQPNDVQMGGVAPQIQLLPLGPEDPSGSPTAIDSVGSFEDENSGWSWPQGSLDEALDETLEEADPPASEDSGMDWHGYYEDPTRLYFA